MKTADVDRFFKTVAERTSHRLDIYITGGIAAMICGGTRPTADIDFALKTKTSWEDSAQTLREVSQDLQIPIQFAEDISRWGMIGLASFTDGAKRYRTFGSIRVFVLHPLPWSVGKMGRYTSDDIGDIVSVFKKQKISAALAVKTWAKAFRESPPSSEKSLFIRQVEDFLRHSGPRIWGKSFEAEILISLFRKSAGLATMPSP